MGWFLLRAPQRGGDLFRIRGQGREHVRFVHGGNHERPRSAAPELLLQERSKPGQDSRAALGREVPVVDVDDEGDGLGGRLGGWLGRSRAPDGGRRGGGVHGGARAHGRAKGDDGNRATILVEGEVGGAEAAHGPAPRVRHRDVDVDDLGLDRECRRRRDLEREKDEQDARGSHGQRRMQDSFL